MDWLIAAVLLGFVAALIAPGVHRLMRPVSGWVLALVPLALTIYFARLAPQIASGQAVAESWQWAPNLGLSFAFRADGLGLLFALLISGVGTLIVIYASSYLKGHPLLGRFYALILIFMASMLGVVLADNLLVIYLFWELTTISSWMLIGFNHQDEAARKAAWQSLIVTAGGGVVMLAGFVMLGQVAGSYELPTIIAAAPRVLGSPLYWPILLTILAGAFTKSAQWPFHFWLPNAMQAPTPVSAYLHSATMVKAGIYLLARLSPVLGGTGGWVWIVTTVGAITAITGGYFAIRARDFKQVLAYSTISALGTIVMLLGVGTPAAAAAAMAFLLAHAGYKGALFLVAGIVDHETGTRQIDELGGLRRFMPVTAAIAVAAGFALAGLWPVLGFIAKEAAYEAILHSGRGAFMLTLTLVIVASLFVAIALIVCVMPFFGPHRSTPKHPHEAPFPMLLGPLLLAGVNWVFGFWSAPVEHYLVSPAAASILAEPHTADLALWHGVNLPLLLSILTTILGLVIYLYLAPLRLKQDRLTFLEQRGPERGYDLAIAGMNASAKLQTQLLQSGYLRFYLMIIMLTTVGLIVYAGLKDVVGLVPSWRASAQMHEVGIVLLMLVGAIAAVRSRSRLGAIAALGVVGYGVSLIFALLGAPDLAMTQFLIETLFVLFFVLVFYHLPPFTLVSKPAARLRDGLIAGAWGLTATLLLLALPSVPLDRTLIDYYLTQSALLAHGSNVVNVILVDFRGFDTMGEITVLSIAGIGVFALLKLRLDRREGR